MSLSTRRVRGLLRDLQAACAQYGYTRGMLPLTEAVTERIVSLPMYPELTVQQIETVATTIRECLWVSR